MLVQSRLEFRTRGRGTHEITAEIEPDVRRDLETLLSRLAPDADPACQHDTEGPDDRFQLEPFGGLSPYMGHKSI